MIFPEIHATLETAKTKEQERVFMEENKMGTIPVSRLVISMALPLMLSLLINSLYNFVDSVFVARVSEDALTAISLAAPMQLIVSKNYFAVSKISI